MQKAATAYLQTSVGTTSQGEILLMLYEGAIKFLRQAQEKIKERDYAQKGILISKALDIISELECSLNMNKGGDIAGNLHRLYFFCQKRLLQANINMDVAMVEEVVTILSGLRSAYQEVIKGNVAPPANAPAMAASVPSSPAATPGAMGGGGTKPPAAAPDQGALLSASFWLQKGRGGASPEKNAASPSPASGQGEPQRPGAGRLGIVPPLGVTGPKSDDDTAPPAAAKRLAGTRLYEKISKTT
ncbi:flagellar export chaperone FliS [Megalodesulfovibrio gigas]|uniref:Putative flagellar protein FliS n=1 Tax=Megalodesulfovibrio gigas (strain ATCC 19364 / DSM 1382 / NCIMB 9332 / VKM B-1759) TaxID=1121448 RepID=T2GFN4_MEGG1|nr:flagellar export chaperone FliS [Megalodesulfovibrio gigas]AGW15088.1 putative flagellar protein FliS [Megalodesulfovibrio gigas DSM 1382 = ATCC 19364]